jgi:uncharacterized damage-inducible protein DinB
MKATKLILRSLEESQENMTKALDGLTQGEVSWCPAEGSNSIAFILWHTILVEDIFINRIIQGGREIYETEGWQEKLGTPTKVYQYTEEELQAWPIPKLEVLMEYANVVQERSLKFLKSITTKKLDEVPLPDRSTNSIGIMLSHLCNEVAMHVGQIAFLRGIQRGLDK